MYYKIIKNNRVIDILTHISYVKFQQKHKIMLNCDEASAQGILSSDGNYIWHLDYLYNFPLEAGDIDTVEIQKIDEYEYNQLKSLNMKTPEEIIDEYTLLLIKGGIL